MLRHWRIYAVWFHSNENGDWKWIEKWKYYIMCTDKKLRICQICKLKRIWSRKHFNVMKTMCVSYMVYMVMIKCIQFLWIYRMHDRYNDDYCIHFCLISIYNITDSSLLYVEIYVLILNKSTVNNSKRELNNLLPFCNLGVH